MSPNATTLRDAQLNKALGVTRPALWGRRCHRGGGDTGPQDTVGSPRGLLGGGDTVVGTRRGGLVVPGGAMGTRGGTRGRHRVPNCSMYSCSARSRASISAKGSSSRFSDAGVGGRRKWGEKGQNWGGAPPKFRGGGVHAYSHLSRGAWWWHLRVVTGGWPGGGDSGTGGGGGPLKVGTHTHTRGGHSRRRCRRRRSGVCG